MSLNVCVVVVIIILNTWFWVSLRKLCRMFRFGSVNLRAIQHFIHHKKRHEMSHEKSQQIKIDSAIFLVVFDSLLLMSAVNVCHQCSFITLYLLILVTDFSE